VTIGVLCDMNRFTRAADPVQWEVFRTAVLEAQGWKFHRFGHRVFSQTQSDTRRRSMMPPLQPPKAHRC
jgi:hypothetical protein